jgi:hypothetical protein
MTLLSACLCISPPPINFNGFTNVHYTWYNIVVPETILKSQSPLTTDSYSASLSWCQTTIRARDQFSFLLEMFLKQLWVCYFMAPTLARGRVCNLLLLPGLANAVPLESRGTQDHILLPQFFSGPNLEGQVPTFIPPRDGVAQLYPPVTGFPFLRLLPLAGTTVEVF